VSGAPDLSPGEPAAHAAGPDPVKHAAASVPLAASVDSSGNLVFASDAQHAPASHLGSAGAGSSGAGSAAGGASSAGHASPGFASTAPEPAGTPAEAGPHPEVGLVGLSDHGGGGLHHPGFHA
jgi:collagen type I/II/III/V/XI/XXIV/XXVII alpha